ncbi:MAG: 3-methyl-2-oxobutanoate hydroxymethyltransferase [Candidatus Margulisbacteria bacterium]|nr:3-methyl-2-oxobutanoate hydroxymethyltransferase [Candidatus Margulisiibacteriota bacterium]
MEKREKVTVKGIKGSRHQGAKIVMLTAYDYPFAKIMDEAGVDIVLVGDSLGNVVLGLPNTRGVTMPDMLHHTRAVARGVKRALLVADVPYRSLSVANARKLRQAGASAVKVEGITRIKTIKQIVGAGIPVMGHLGYLPQTDPKPAISRSESLIGQAKELEKAGAFAIVLELVEPKLAKKIAESVTIPTIGIGSGKNCAGQVLVTYDLLGLSDWSPRFAKKKIDLRRIILRTLREFVAENK